ncbi:hypothetical protein C0V97_12295 [Asaia sp. W19]|nr:hypothetical protein C0V97_12295 [Asaia sp. W19]
MSEIFRQAQWEMVGVRRAQKIFMEDMERATASGRLHETGPGRRLLRKIVTPLAEEIRNETDKAIAAAGERGRKSVVGDCFMAFTDKHLEVAIVATATVLGNVGMSFAPPVTRLSKSVAAALRSQLSYNQMQEQAKAEKSEGDDTLSVLLTRFKERYKNPNVRQWKEWTRRAGVLVKAEWSEIHSITVGAWLIERICVASEGAIVTAEVAADPTKPCARCVVASSQTVQDLLDDAEKMSLSAPRLMAMVTPPLTWK